MSDNNTAGVAEGNAGSASQTAPASQQDNVRWGTGFKRDILIAGTLCSFFIGAGFATGQEALQYFTAHGWWGIVAIAIVIVAWAWVLTSLTEWGRRHQDDEHADPFVDICGKMLGTLFRVLVPLFIFAVAVTMVAGAGALFHDIFSVPTWAGSTIMASVLAATLLLGFRRLVEILGRVGPIIIGFVVLVSVWIIITEFETLSSATEMLAEYQPAKAMDNLWLSTILYCASVLLMAVPFLASLGKTVGSTASMAPGSLLASGGFGGGMMLTALALMATLPMVFDKGTPLVLLGNEIWPILGYGFFIVTFLGIYTTAAPMLWIITDQVPTPNRRCYQLVVALLCIVTLVGGLIFPFDQLVGRIYPFIGIFGAVFFALLIVYQIRRRMTGGKA